MWIARYYGELAISDWSDEKYSIDAYKIIIQNEIKDSYKVFCLVDFSLSECELNNCRVILKSRNQKSRWTEDISYNLEFFINNIAYCYIEQLDETDVVKEICEVKAYDAGNYFIIIQKLARDYFEDDDYYDYIIRGVKAKK